MTLNTICCMQAELREAARDRHPGQDSSKLLLPKKDGDEDDKREVDVLHMTRTQVCSSFSTGTAAPADSMSEGLHK